jgi:hypothetical protein
VHVADKGANDLGREFYRFVGDALKIGGRAANRESITPAKRPRAWGGCSGAANLASNKVVSPVVFLGGCPESEESTLGPAVSSKPSGLPLRRLPLFGFPAGTLVR